MVNLPLPASCGLDLAQEVFDFLDDCGAPGLFRVEICRQTPLAQVIEGGSVQDLAHCLETRFGVVAAFSDLGPDATVGTLFDLIFDQLTQTPAAGSALTDR